jgi:hypothetical protein
LEACSEHKIELKYLGMILHDEKLRHYDCKGAEDKVEKKACTWRENFTVYGGSFFV